MANNFEAAAFALQCAFPKNKILMDDKGMPSVFVWIPAFRLCDVLSTASTDIHPAFRVNGKEIAGFYFGKYQTKVYNERAYSLPAEDPTVSQNFDWFASKTKANGTGWHEATVAEWAAVACGATSADVSRGETITMARTQTSPPTMQSPHLACRTEARPPAC